MTQPRPHKTIDPEISDLAARHGYHAEALLEIFQDLQERYGGLTSDQIADTARALQIPAEKAQGVASFYSMLSLKPAPQKVVRLCDGPVCWLKNARGTRAAIEAAIYQDGHSGAYRVERTSCLGLCDRAPAALVGDEQTGPVTPEEAGKITQKWRGQATDYSQPLPGELRVMLSQTGQVDPDDLKSALEHGSYQALAKALKTTPDVVLDTVEGSGLTGRGGAGFPVGRKWRFVRQATQTPKVIICNADESEPLIFKDRVLIDTHPHQILEGMALSAYATGASVGYIYIRGEYVKQADRLERAISQAEAAGWLGKNIQGTDFSFDIHVHRGAGAYICGEETALIESLEGKRGEPRTRPPYPPSYGYKGLPTLVNNVESYAASPAIVLNGADWYRSLSTWKTPGTKIYMILGHINRPGLFEAPFGITLRQAIDQFGGGMRDGSQFHFALTGGAAGTIVPESLLDIPIDYSSAAQGVSLGAGAFLVCDHTVKVNAFLRELLHFFQIESCGKCTPCRIGTQQCLEILTRIADGQAQPGDAERLLQTAEMMQVASFCGLGQSVAIPVKSAVTQFASDFVHHSAQTR